MIDKVITLIILAAPMNLLILEEQHFTSDTDAQIIGPRALHIHSVLRLGIGDKISLGRLNGFVGRGTISSSSKNLVEICDISLDTPPTPPLPLTLILAMPRPQMLKRILQTTATMGVKKLCLIQTSRVEKSFWQSPSATPSAMRDNLILGLEQGVATQLPEIYCYKRLGPLPKMN